MANTKEFFTKNKKAIYIGGGLLLAVGAFFGYNAWKKNKDEKLKMANENEKKKIIQNVVSEMRNQSHKTPRMTRGGH